MEQTFLSFPLQPWRDVELFNESLVGSQMSVAQAGEQQKEEQDVQGSSSVDGAV